MSLYLSQLVDPERQAACQQHDAADAQFDRALHRIVERDCRNCPTALGIDQGHGCECSREATEAALRNAWAWISNTVQNMDVGDWLAVLAVVCAIAAYWSH